MWDKRTMFWNGPRLDLPTSDWFLPSSCKTPNRLSEVTRLDPAVKILSWPYFQMTVYSPSFLATHVSKASEPSVTMTGWVKLLSNVVAGKFECINFTNVLLEAFTLADPISAKMKLSHQCCFALLGSLSVKAVSKTLVKSTQRSYKESRLM